MKPKRIEVSLFSKFTDIWIYRLREYRSGGLTTTKTYMSFKDLQSYRFTNRRGQVFQGVVMLKNGKAIQSHIFTAL